MYSRSRSTGTGNDDGKMLDWFYHNVDLDLLQSHRHRDPPALTGRLYPGRVCDAAEAVSPATKRSRIAQL